MKIEVLDKGFVEYIDHMGSDQRIVEAARVSYNGHSKGEAQDKKLLSYLYRNKHSSPFEMAQITFKIKLPLFVAAQFNRHRMQSLNYVSFRYTEPEDDFYIPEKWRKQSTDNKQVSNEVEDWTPKCKWHALDTVEYSGHNEVSSVLSWHCNGSLDLYKSMVSNGIGREMARMVLPQNLYTSCYSSWDLNNLIKFFHLRDHSHAQWEIQQYAKGMKEITKQYFPWVMELIESEN